MHKSQIKQKVREIIASMFAVTVSDVPDNCALGYFERWDSLGHMNLILALEEEFGIRFLDEEVAELLSIDLMVDTILCHLNKK